MAGFSIFFRAHRRISPQLVLLMLVGLLSVAQGVAAAQVSVPTGERSSGYSLQRDVADAMESQSVEDKVEQFHAALMRNASSRGDFPVRAAIVAPAFDAVFDIERIARISAGRNWRDLNATTRADYVGLLRNVVIATYISRFDADRGQSFETLSTEEVKPQRFIVKTHIKRLANNAVALDYYFSEGRVFNVVADGVSDLSLRRADYAAIIKASGFDGLLEHLRAQLATAQASVESGAKPNDGA